MNTKKRKKQMQQSLIEGQSEGGGEKGSVATIISSFLG